MTRETVNGLPVYVRRKKNGWCVIWGRTDVGCYRDFETAAREAASIFLEEGRHEQS